jgi:hypothetical protein
LCVLDVVINTLMFKSEWKVLLTLRRKLRPQKGFLKGLKCVLVVKERDAS